MAAKAIGTALGPLSSRLVALPCHYRLANQWRDAWPVRLNTKTGVCEVSVTHVNSGPVPWLVTTAADSGGLSGRLGGITEAKSGFRIPQVKQPCPTANRAGLSKDHGGHSMLVLSRTRNESIQVGDDILITIVEIDRGQVKIGIEAPKEVSILRFELIAKRANQNTPNNP